jgi:hypothetical protein
VGPGAAGPGLSRVAKAPEARRGALPGEIARRVAGLDWKGIAEALDRDGYALIPELVRAEERRALADLYGREPLFRKRVDMQRHRFGVGEYKYFAHPLPPLVARLREALYPRVAPLANRWQARLGAPRLPESYARFRALCRAAGQTRPTPLLLHYREGGLNHLHQDLYGEVAFPLQVTCLLSRPGRDFTGGEFLLLETRPRTQSRGEAVTLAAGEAILFPTRERPVQGARGWMRAQVRHGVSRVRSGERLALGLIFHDARS